MPRRSRLSFGHGRMAAPTSLWPWTSWLSPFIRPIANAELEWSKGPLSPRNSFWWLKLWLQKTRSVMAVPLDGPFRCALGGKGRPPRAGDLAFLRVHLAVDEGM
jgi:hypothetical protein